MWKNLCIHVHVNQHICINVGYVNLDQYVYIYGYENLHIYVYIYVYIWIYVAMFKCIIGCLYKIVILIYINIYMFE